MKPEELRQLAQLRIDQRRLQADLQALDERIFALEASAADTREALPPPLPTHSAPTLAPAPLAAEPPLLETPEPAPRPNTAAPAPISMTARERRAAAPLPFPPSPARPARPRESLELQLGAVWLARIGIVMLLTGLVFLGNYAWQTFGSHLGPAGRLTLLYLASGALAGLGAWMHRRQESLRLYAQVLIGGGAALAYYSTYAAHYVARLRVIESPLGGGLLLLLCGGGLLALAERRRWQLAALLTILLSYYTAGINPIGEFTLYSNLLLTAARVVLLLRRQWMAVTWATLAGTYGSYAFWHLYRHAAETGLRAAEPWRTGLVFLVCYWVFFTAAVFLARREHFVAQQRVAFLTLNNAAFVFFAVDHLLNSRPSLLWALCVAAGGVLLALAAAAWRWRREEPALDGAYLLQGVALVTAGLAQKLAGPQLAVVLAVESLILLTGAGRRHSWLWLLLASILSAWAACLGALEMYWHPETTVPLGVTLSLLLIADAWWLKQRTGELPALRVSFHPARFAGLGLLTGALAMSWKAGPGWEANLFALAALVCTASVYVVRLPEVVLGGQLYLVWAIALCLDEGPGGQPWWMIWPVGASALALAHWWQRQRFLAFAKGESLVLQALSAGALVIFGLGWMQQHLTGDPWLAALSGAVLGTLVYGRLTGSWSIAACGQLFACAAAAVFAQSLFEGTGRWPAGLTPALALLGSWGLLPAALGRSRAATPLVSAYWWSGLGLLAVWVFRYVPEGWQSLTLAGLFLLLLGAAGWRQHALSALGSAGFALLTYVAVCLELSQAPDLRSLAALLLVPAAARRCLHFLEKPPAETRRALGVISGLAAGSLWLWVTRWCQWHGYDRSLTIAWSGTALVVLGAGLALRERVYRVGGFAILALAVGRIFLVDVWQLETIYRILSFLSLGGVLLLLGFLYSRYSEQIRRWL